jgi:TRAP-type C4-dicarboxylate transport system permease small subunit
MEWITKKTEGLSQLLNIVAGIALTFMMLITVLDVILRYFRMPIVGTYELVALSGGLVVGFSLPLTTFSKGQVIVDFFVMRFSPKRRAVFHVVTRVMGIALFFLIGWNMISMGMDMLHNGEVSLTLELPYYPIAFGIGLACFVQCWVSLVQIVQVIGGSYD